MGCPSSTVCGTHQTTTCPPSDVRPATSNNAAAVYLHLTEVGTKLSLMSLLEEVLTLVERSPSVCSLS